MSSKLSLVSSKHIYIGVYLADCLPSLLASGQLARGVRLNHLNCLVPGLSWDGKVYADKTLPIGPDPPHLSAIADAIMSKRGVWQAYSITLMTSLPTGKLDQSSTSSIIPHC